MTESSEWVRARWERRKSVRINVAAFVKAMRLLVRKRGRAELSSYDEQNYIELFYSDEFLIIRQMHGRMLVVRKDLDKTLIEVRHGRVAYAEADPEMLDHAIRLTVLERLAE